MATAGTESLPSLPMVTQLSDRVTRILGGNPSPFTLQGTNSYLIGQGHDCILIDTSSPSKPAYIVALEKTLQETNRRIDRVLLTHWHMDHVGSLDDVKTLCQKMTGTTPTVYKFPTTTTQQSIPVVAEPLTDGMRFSVDDEDTHIVVIFAPGHTDDHCTFLLEEESVLFSGDAILGHGSTYFEHLPSYLCSLELLFNRSSEFTQIYPGHGAVVEKSTEKIASYLDHRRKRIDEILAAMRVDKVWLSDRDLLLKVYVDIIPEKEKAALAVQRQSLEYLETKGLIEMESLEDTKMWRYIPPKL